MPSPLDPFGLARYAGEALRLTGRGLDWVEAQVHQALTPPDPAARAGLEESTQASAEESTGQPTPAPSPAPVDNGLGTKMRSLLSRAIEQSTRAGRDELFHHVLDQLVPDEARIISALAQGGVSPVVTVYPLNRAGILGEPLIDNAAGVGRSANLALPAMTPNYVGHLLSLGLVEIGPEDEDLKEEYQILQADSDVLKAIRKGSRGPIPARVVRRTLRLSAFGHALWDAAIGDQE